MQRLLLRTGGELSVRAEELCLPLTFSHSRVPTGSLNSSRAPAFMAKCIYYAVITPLILHAAPPSVTSPPEESVEAARGSTVTFTCQAVGVPTPIITWRLNWGHIPVSSRWVHSLLIFYTVILIVIKLIAIQIVQGVWKTMSQ